MRRPQLAEFMRRMDSHSIAIIASAREAVRSNDTTYRFRQDSDFYYLTGFNEPEAIAVIAPEDEKPYTLFVRPRDPEKETWDGPRAGVEGAIERYGADAAFPIGEFQGKLQELLKGKRTLYYRLGVDHELDRVIIGEIARMRALGRRGIVPPQTIVDTGALLHEMRLIKSDDEIALIQRAAEITAEAHREAMTKARPGMREYEIEALIEYIFRRRGATAAYNSIIGSGANATILHYSINDAVLREGDLLLIDAGAEYQGYAADITRTFPVSGRFSKEQRDIYEVVLETQKECIEMVRPGVTIDELHNRSVEILTEGMIRLGLLAGDASQLIKEEVYKRFYMHRLGHYLGLDVHDVGLYYVDGQSRRLEAGMVITIEPGLYVAREAEAPERYRGIGVRIEDDVLVTTEGHRVLTSGVPKEIEELEDLIARARERASHPIA
ncbi:Xaa-Pro aminopeptidase [Pyrinomonas methylaliphatogenes]|uniref:Xaa-Pro aminopeptidase n=1 Tax=Pyrinomonas methylaliphatogenes TaxID=454194 RepID=A0A0B6X3A2_9BACT|nr:Xaa-Pro aminopeptidase [Pyrinomonas methylaliphatogenes]CDM66989.1 aminopeptidase P [Pyrinomonas methylaliphatogenes]